jgi:hypothetical protein
MRVHPAEIHGEGFGFTRFVRSAPSYDFLELLNSWGFGFPRAPSLRVVGKFRPLIASVLPPRATRW